MLALKTILHATDFSEPSRSAFDLACHLANDHGAKLILLHVVEPPTELLPLDAGTMVPNEMMEEMGRALDRVRPSDPDLDIVIERRVEQGEPATLILTVAEECEADMIVLATHGRTGLRRLLLGSVAEHVLREAPCPVVTLRKPVPAKEKADGIAMV